MAFDFATKPFTFKIDLAFNFEMKDKVQIDARENGKSWKRLAQHVGQTAMEHRTCIIFNVFDRWRGHVINRILHSWSINMKFMKLVV